MPRTHHGGSGRKARADGGHHHEGDCGGGRHDGGRDGDHRHEGDRTGKRGGGRRGGGRGDRRRERRRDDQGQFVETADREAVLSVFDAVEGPVVTTTDVSDVLGITTEGARRKLNELVTDGPLRRRKTGRTVVYWKVTESEDGELADSEP
jgi:uncharacterized sporulation protein YeaH/YhbH (DUF444 family)